MADSKEVKIAFLLAIHNLPEQANIFIKQVLTYEGSYVFVHIDKKALNIAKKIYKNNRVVIVPFSYEVNWGDYAQIQYVLDMMKFAADKETFDYYSVHSGCDLLVRPMQEFVNFLKEDHAYAYLDCFRLPDKRWQYGGGMGRIKLYWPRFFRRRVRYNSPIRYLRSMYGKAYGAHLLPGRKILNIQYWGKSAWYTLGKECVDRMLNYLQTHEDILNQFETSLCGDEIFFNTMVHLTHRLNIDDKIVDQNNLRYIDFKNINPREPGAPKTLDIKDIDSIEKTDAFFVRKTDLKKSKELIAFYRRRTGSL